MTTRKALLIGINYRGTSSALNGCINDVASMKKYLLQNGYKEEDMTILTDDTDVKPTRTNMITAILNLLLTGADRLFFHYSGHGSWERDLNGDEKDGRDESLVPLDYNKAGMLTDDQLRGLLTFMSPRSKMTVVLDCCHSGTGMDLAYCLKKRNRFVRVKKGNRYVRVNKPVTAMDRDRRYQDTPGHVVMLSGCLDKQYSADAYEAGKYQGAMTYCLLKAMEEKKEYTWGELVDCVRGLLKKNRYEQIPNLTSGKSLALTSKVDFC